jgi:hypothetical protein
MDEQKNSEGNSRESNGRNTTKRRNKNENKNKYNDKHKLLQNYKWEITGQETRKSEGQRGV